jgi:hypothetical protein
MSSIQNGGAALKRLIKMQYVIQWLKQEEGNSSLPSLVHNLTFTTTTAVCAKPNVGNKKRGGTSNGLLHLNVGPLGFM